MNIKLIVNKQDKEMLKVRVNNGRRYTTDWSSINGELVHFYSVCLDEFNRQYNDMVIQLRCELEDYLLKLP